MIVLQDDQVAQIIEACQFMRAQHELAFNFGAIKKTRREELQKAINIILKQVVHGYDRKESGENPANQSEQEAGLHNEPRG